MNRWQKTFLHKALAVLHISPPPSQRACVLILGVRFAKQSLVCIPSRTPVSSSFLLFFLFIFYSTNPFPSSRLFHLLFLPLFPTNDLISYSLQPKQVYHARRYQIVKRADRSSFHFLYSTRIPAL